MYLARFKEDLILDLIWRLELKGNFLRRIFEGQEEQHSLGIEIPHD